MRKKLHELKAGEKAYIRKGHPYAFRRVEVRRLYTNGMYLVKLSSGQSMLIARGRLCSWKVKQVSPIQALITAIKGRFS